MHDHWTRRRFSATAIVAGSGLATGRVVAAAEVMPVLYRQDFDELKAVDGKIEGWTPTDPNAWSLKPGRDGKGQALALVKQSKYAPKHRSPLNYTLIDDLYAGDFVFDVSVKSTARDYGHRDLCLFFGWVDADHFYYVHFGRDADAAAHSVFLVNAAPRVSIAKKRTKGAPWTDGWHRLRVERSGSAIRVFFDDLKTAVMEADDAAFPVGRLGVGSFDDVGLFDEIEIRGRRAEQPAGPK
ncbi:MAG: hypothetical protein ACRC1K_06815 [Planctomycetia bacterium]